MALVNPSCFICAHPAHHKCVTCGRFYCGSRCQRLDWYTLGHAGQCGQLSPSEEQALVPLYRYKTMRTQGGSTENERRLFIKGATQSITTIQEALVSYFQHLPGILTIVPDIGSGAEQAITEVHETTEALKRLDEEIAEHDDLLDRQFSVLAAEQWLRSALFRQERILLSLEVGYEQALQTAEYRAYDIFDDENESDSEEEENVILPPDVERLLLMHLRREAQQATVMDAVTRVMDEAETRDTPQSGPTVEEVQSRLGMRRVTGTNVVLGRNQSEFRAFGFQNAKKITKFIQLVFDDAWGHHPKVHRFNVLVDTVLQWGQGKLIQSFYMRKMAEWVKDHLRAIVNEDDDDPNLKDTLLLPNLYKEVINDWIAEERRIKNEFQKARYQPGAAGTAGVLHLQRQVATLAFARLLKVDKSLQHVQDLLRFEFLDAAVDAIRILAVNGLFNSPVAQNILNAALAPTELARQVLGDPDSLPVFYPMIQEKLKDMALPKDAQIGIAKVFQMGRDHEFDYKINSATEVGTMMVTFTQSNGLSEQRDVTKELQTFINALKKDPTIGTTKLAALLYNADGSKIDPAIAANAFYLDKPDEFLKHLRILWQYVLTRRPGFPILDGKASLLNHILTLVDWRTAVLTGVVGGGITLAVLTDPSALLSTTVNLASQVFTAVLSSRYFFYTAFAVRVINGAIGLRRVEYTDVYLDRDRPAGMSERTYHQLLAPDLGDTIPQLLRQGQSALLNYVRTPANLPTVTGSLMAWWDARMVAPHAMSYLRAIVDYTRRKQQEWQSSWKNPLKWNSPGNRALLAASTTIFLGLSTATRDFVLRSSATFSTATSGPVARGASLAALTAYIPYLGPFIAAGTEYIIGSPGLAIVAGTVTLYKEFGAPLANAGLLYLGNRSMLQTMLMMISNNKGAPAAATPGRRGGQQAPAAPAAVAVAAAAPADPDTLTFWERLLETSWQRDMFIIFLIFLDFYLFPAATAAISTADLNTLITRAHVQMNSMGIKVGGDLDMATLRSVLQQHVIQC